MSFRSLFVLAVAVVTGMVHVDVPGQTLVLSAGSQQVFGAEPQKHKDLGNGMPSGDVLGFTGRGGEPFALERSVPGVVGAVELTAEQKQKIGAAVAETTQSEKVRAAVVLAKLNPNATQAQKNEAQKLVAEARGKLRQLVAQILTDEQKKLVANINTAAEQARREVLESLQAEQSPEPGRDDRGAQTMNHRPITRRDFVCGTAGAAGAALVLQGSPTSGQTPAAKEPLGVTSELLTPLIASPWTRIVEHPQTREGLSS